MHICIYSRWWQGLEIHEGNITYNQAYEISSPLIGVDFNLSSAQNLAQEIDTMQNTPNIVNNTSQSTILVNFAHISLTKSNIIGEGSFSKVYR